MPERKSPNRPRRQDDRSRLESTRRIWTMLREPESADRDGGFRFASWNLGRASSFRLEVQPDPHNFPTIFKYPPRPPGLRACRCEPSKSASVLIGTRYKCIKHVVVVVTALLCFLLLFTAAYFLLCFLLLC